MTLFEKPCQRATRLKLPQNFCGKESLNSARFSNSRPFCLLERCLLSGQSQALLFPVISIHGAQYLTCCHVLMIDVVTIFGSSPIFIAFYHCQFVVYHLVLESVVVTFLEAKPGGAGGLPRRSPLRTGRTSFPIYGSSTHQPLLPKQPHDETPPHQTSQFPGRPDVTASRCVCPSFWVSPPRQLDSHMPSDSGSL
jgi:hypothetical protein